MGKSKEPPRRNTGNKPPNESAGRPGGEPPRMVPDWNPDTGVLTWQGQYKHYREDALAPRAILGAFQQAGWCESIENPLPEDPQIPRVQLLETTVSNLNRSLKGWGIRFHAEGKGSRVRWEAFV